MRGHEKIRISIREILEFIRSSPEFGCVVLPQDANPTRLITDVKQDWEAQSGDIAWVSTRQASIHPEKLGNFRGSLLICSSKIDRQLWNSSTMVICDNPKLTFIKVLKQFFEALAVTQWPKDGQAIIGDCIMGVGVRVSQGAIIGSGVVIEDNVEIGPNSVIGNCRIERDVTIGANCSIGLPGFGFEQDEHQQYWRLPHLGGVSIHRGVEIGSNTCIDRGAIGDTTIGSGVKIDNLVHIAHNVTIGANSIIIANAMVGGSATIGENTWVAPSVSILNQLNLGKSAYIGMGAVVLRDVPDAAVVVGNPAKKIRDRKIHE